jgi:hypothetical protein
MSVAQPDTLADEKTFCAVHPTAETGLRCNKCGRYMCVKCAIKTPVGYRCRQCVNQQQAGFFTATNTDYLIAAVVSVVVGLPAAFSLTRTGLFLIIILGLPVGGFIGEVIHRAVGKRRGQYTWAVAAGGIALATLIVTLTSPTLRSIFALADLDPEIRAMLTETLIQALIEPVLFAAICAFGAVARLRYGK